MSTFSLHEGMAHAVGLPFELHEPAVVDDAVDGRRRNLVVSEGRPQRENSMFVVIATDCRLRASANV